MDRSNSDAQKERIAELRRLVQSRKGMIKRAEDSRLLLSAKIRECRAEIRDAQQMIEMLGGTVRR